MRIGVKPLVPSTIRSLRDAVYEGALDWQLLGVQINTPTLTLETDQRLTGAQIKTLKQLWKGKNAMQITITKEEAELIRKGDWDWFHTKVLGLLPPEPPKWEVGTTFEMKTVVGEWEKFEVTASGPDSSDPSIVVYRSLETGKTNQVSAIQMGNEFEFDVRYRNIVEPPF